MNRMTSFFVKSLFPSVSRRGAFGNPLFVVFVLLQNNRSWTTTFQDDGNNNTKTLHKKSPGLNRGLLYPPNKPIF